MNQDQTINLNHNAAECIKSASKFGETIYTNICNGNVSHVVWGGVDWAGMLILMALGVGFLLMLLAFGFSIIRD